MKCMCNITNKSTHLYMFIEVMYNIHPCIYILVLALLKQISLSNNTPYIKTPDLWRIYISTLNKWKIVCVCMLIVVLRRLLGVSRCNLFNLFLAVFESLRDLNIVDFRKSYSVLGYFHISQL